MKTIKLFLIIFLCMTTVSHAEQENDNLLVHYNFTFFKFIPAKNDRLLIAKSPDLRVPVDQGINWFMSHGTLVKIGEFARDEFLRKDVVVNKFSKDDQANWILRFNGFSIYKNELVYQAQFICRRDLGSRTITSGGQKINLPQNEVLSTNPRGLLPNAGERFIVILPNSKYSHGDSDNIVAIVIAKATFKK